ncbi:MAG: hypothetical protein ACREVO_06010 [Steroidobacteraceae bacterium]
MRGTIIMWSGDKGVIAAADKRYDFNISQWQGAVAPAANMTVEVQVSDTGMLTSAMPVSEADLAKEKLNQMSAQGSKVAQAVLGDVGRDVAIAYGVFLIAALFMSVVGGNGMVGSISITLADLLSGNMGLSGLVGAGSGKGTFLVLLATATIAVPHYWKHKLAPLALCVPLLFTLYAFYPVYQAYSQARAQAAQAGAMFGETSRSFDSGFSLGLGAYAVLIAGAYLAFRGIKRYLGRPAG